MNRILSVLILFCFSTSFGQSLSPNESLLTMSEYQYQYYSKIREKLLKDEYENMLVKLIVLPSFQAEYSFRIVKKENEFFGIVILPDENIWYSKDSENLSVKSYISPIKNEGIQLIFTYLDQILSKTKYPEKINYTTDGVRYILSKNNKSGTFRTGDNFPDFYIIKIFEKMVHQIIKEEEVFLTKEEIEELKVRIVEK